MFSGQGGGGKGVGASREIEDGRWDIGEFVNVNVNVNGGLLLDTAKNAECDGFMAIL